MKKVLKVLGLILATIALIVGGYVGYVYLQYHRIPDNQALKITGTAKQTLTTGKAYKMTTFNIGYGSYPADYTFFMDGGKEVRARSKAAVEAAIAEDIDLLKAENPDIINLQEVDWDGDRSEHVNEPLAFENVFTSYDSAIAQNYDSAYLFYPVTDPIGKAKSGLVTLTKYDMTQSTRYQLPIQTNFDKFFDLDRAFSVSELSIANGKSLMIFNTHMSAYITDQTIQKAQLTTLFEKMAAERDKGNYVIVAGDFNHVLTGQAHPELTWMKPFPTEEMDKRFRVVAPTNAPSVRAIDIPYTPGKTTTGTIDGFLVSDNIKDLSVKTIVNNFKSSDHEPVSMTFELS
jgi:endonuclease/exonuclease/phosphatase family metal-dependent hydrolase